MADRHTKTGNCWDCATECILCGVGLLCDVCHVHCEPRGDCETCDDCLVCETDKEADLR